MTDVSDEGRCRVRKVSASPQTGYDPEVSEWRNPSRVRDTVTPSSLILRSWRKVGELKYLSSRKKEIKRDSPSSDERSGNSPNQMLASGVVGLQYLVILYRRRLWKESP